MLTIRLRRIGKKHHPTFRFIVSEKQKDTKGDFLEDLGFYDPHPSPSVVEPKEDRIKHWLAQGAKPSDTVHNLLVTKGIIQGERKKVWTAKKKKATEGEGEQAPESSKSEEAKPEVKKEVKPEIKEETKEEKPAEKPKEAKSEEKQTEAEKEPVKEEKKEEAKPEEAKIDKDEK
ncbi:MAG: 30S ribosomal protein S16 [Patescibacteria group bacterium]